MIEIPPNQNKPNHIFLIYTYKEDLALNNQHCLIFHDLVDANAFSMTLSSVFTCVQLNINEERI